MSSSHLDPIQDRSDTASLGIPALVVSGFLGAGKTTLIRHVLQEAQQSGLRLAIVSNEFGELGIDEALLRGDGGGDYVELEGGCVCCKLSNELLSTIQELWERVHPDRVIVETSGVALPFETLMTFWREPVSQWVGESLALVVVNAEQVVEERDLLGTFEQQVSSADLLAVNKIDLVSRSDFGRVKALLEEMAPGTPIVRSINGKIDTNILFPSNPADRNVHSPARRQSTSSHTHEAFESQILEIENGVNPDTLIQQLKRHDALRIKGVVQTSSGLRIVQGVGARLDLITPSADLPQRLIGQVVLIRRSQQAPSTH